jgi:UDP-glucose 4-epimerase
MQLKNKKVLVTGGAGFIPSHVTDLLVKKGAIVTAIDNLKTGSLRNLEKSKDKINFQKIDVRDFKKVKGVVRDQDIVFHFAANADVPYSVKHPKYDFDTNTIGGFNILKSCVDFNVKKVIYASSAAVYGEAKYIPIDEKHPLNPCSPYGASKLATESLGFAYYKTYGLPFITIRIFNTYGERQPRYVMYDLLKKLYKDPTKLEVLGTGEQIRDYCYVTDAARAFILAAENGNAVGEVFNLAGGNPISIKQFVKLLLKILKLKDTKVHYTGKSWKGDIIKLVADVSKMKKILSFEPKMSFTEGVQKLHNWLVKQDEKRI